jgi:DNA-binding response OmpR family regulator
LNTILLVDDEDAIRGVFSIFLERSGFAILTAAGGEECLGILQKEKPDLIILDIMMQPIDGWETLSSIRRNHDTSNVPVIMFSGKSPMKEEIEQYGKWIEDYLMKPMKFVQISDVISTILDRCKDMRVKRERMISFGADPLMIEEFVCLTRSLFIRKKFSGVSYKNLDGYEHDLSSIEDRINQLAPEYPGQKKP